MDNAPRLGNAMGLDVPEMERERYQDWFDVMRSWFLTEERTEASVR